MGEKEIEAKSDGEIVHPKGEEDLEPGKARMVNTFGGVIRLEWERDAPMTAMGLLPFFIEFLKEGKQFEGWVEDCPLHMTSPNAPPKVDILGTYLLGVLEA